MMMLARERERESAESEEESEEEERVSQDNRADQREIIRKQYRGLIDEAVGTPRMILRMTNNRKQARTCGRKR